MAVYLYNIRLKRRGIGLFNSLKVTVLYLQLSRIQKDLTDISKVSNLKETVTGKILFYSNILL
jgi:hypothetical protein